MYKLVIVLLLVFVTVFGTNASHKNDNDNFIDVGIQLTKSSNDYLIADLIAAEWDFINAGHVSVE